MFDADSVSKIKVFADNVHIEGERSCELMVEEMFPDKTFEPAPSKKKCGKFEVEVPAPPCYNFYASRKSKVIDDPNKYILKKTEYGEYLFEFYLT